MVKLSLLFSVFSFFRVSHAETVTWAMLLPGLPYEPLTMYAGDTITFEYPGDNINVYLHPSGTCNDADSELIGAQGAGTATYTFKDREIDTIVTFACQYWNYCEMFGMIINVTVLEPPPSSSPTSPPSKTAAPTTGPEPTAAPVAVATPPPTAAPKPTAAPVAAATSPPTAAPKPTAAPVAAATPAPPISFCLRFDTACKFKNLFS